MSEHRGKDEPQEPEWMMFGLDPKFARRQGMPERIPVRKENFEAIADKGLKPDDLRKWIEDFLANSEPGQSATWRRRNSAQVSALEAYVAKGALLTKAQAAFAENDFAKATKLLKQVTVLDPEDHSAKMNLASALANQREYDKALKNLKAVRDTYADDPDYHVTVAQIHVAMHKSDEAIEELVLALEAKPDHMPAMDALAKLGVLTAVYEDPRVAASLTYVKTEALLDYLKERWDSEPRARDYYLQQLAYHERERRPAVALQAADRAIAAAPEPCEPAELGKVAALRALGRNDEAIAHAKGYVERAPRSAAALVELAHCLGAAGQADEARARVEQALEIDPGDQNALVLRFWPADREDLVRVSEALPALGAFAEAHAAVAGVWRSVARAKLVVGAEEEALGLFEKAVALAPSDDDLRGEWWAELAKLQRYPEILADAAKLGDMKHRHWALRWNEAEAYRGLGKMVEARGCFTALNMDPELHIDLRKRAKRAAQELGMPGTPGGPPLPPATTS